MMVVIWQWRLSPADPWRPCPPPAGTVVVSAAHPAAFIVSAADAERIRIKE